jgi:predicted DNA-binding protein
MIMKLVAAKRRTANLVVRLNKEERQRFKAVAKHGGESQAEMVRRLVLEEERRVLLADKPSEAAQSGAP